MHFSSRHVSAQMLLQRLVSPVLGGFKNQTLIVRGLHLHRSYNKQEKRVFLAAVVAPALEEQEQSPPHKHGVFSPHSQLQKKKKKMSPSSSGAGPAFASAARRLSLRAVTRLIRQNIYNLII